MKLAERRERFVEVAEHLFLQHGYSGVSVNQVVRLAGGSLATLYAEFRTKEQLFEAVMCRRAAAIFEEAGTPLLASDGVVDELRALATRMQSRMLSADGLAMYRLAVSEAPRFPALRKALLTVGHGGLLRRLADYFERLSDNRLIEIDDPQLAAERFVTLLQGQQQFVAVCGNGVRITRADRIRHVERAVDAFLSIYPASAPSG